MSKAERQSWIALPIVVLIAAGISWAGSQGSVDAGGIPLFLLCGVLAFAMNWIAFIPAYIYQTERYYDLTGSATYVTLVLAALGLQGEPDRRALLLGLLVLIWAGRLGWFLFARISRDGSDRRFDALKPSFRRFVLAWTLQGLWVLLTLACALAAMTSPRSLPPGVFAVLGSLVWLVGFGIEVAADHQKRRFRADPANRGRFIRSGLWA